MTVAGGNVEIAPSAVVVVAVVAAGGSVDLAAPVGSAAKIAAGTLIIANRIAGDVEAAVGTLRITSRADIDGNVSYWSSREVAVSEGARVKGKIVRNVPPERPRIFPAALFAWLVFVSINFVCTLVLGLLSARFLPRYHQSVITTLGEKPWASAGNRTCRGSCRAGGMRAPVSNNCGHTDWTDSSGRVFHTALLVANLCYRPNW